MRITINRFLMATCMALACMSIQAKTISENALIDNFWEYIETLDYFKSDEIANESQQIDNHIHNLNNCKDKDVYIAENGLDSVIRVKEEALQNYQDETETIVTNFMARYKKYYLKNRYVVKDSLRSILRNKLQTRRGNLERLESEVNLAAEEKSFSWKDLDWRLIGLCAGLALMIAALIIWFSRANKKHNKKTQPQAYSNVSAQEASSAIVVRRKTTSILRKQSLEDVIDNPAYLKIDCNEFCDQSAVRRIYLKNTCIKDIYNIYAEDLRNPENPKEDGCMVLGRWVHDSENNEYYVSLEHVILPGDDAVFSEYELNFGGKIKLKVTEKLRKLRRETNLQYDLTCWVHSHPGLGVFFSNSDSNVQMQLKHPTHPNFLTAIVVDILTPDQEMGIFTFRPDSTLNAKSDLTRLYSLEELYKWAVESERNTFKREDHYDTLAKATAHNPECHGIQLSNGAIIDLGMLAIEQESGLAGLIHGFSQREGVNTEVIAAKVCKDKAVPDNELIGCFITAQHCSIPTVRKAVADYMDTIRFVLVYSASDGVLTSIPVINKELCTDENYYGEQQLEDLKIWTRRKR